MATQGQGGVSVRFTQTGVEEMQKSIEGLNETIQQLAKAVAQLSGGEKELATTTQELNRVQNQVSVSSGLGNNALRRQLVSVSRLQGGIAALIPELGSTSYAFRRVAIAAGGILTINPAFVALAGAVAAVGLVLNHVQEEARKAREEMQKLAETNMQATQRESNFNATAGRSAYQAGRAVNFGEGGNVAIDKYQKDQERTIEFNKADIETYKQLEAEQQKTIDKYDQLALAQKRAFGANTAEAGTVIGEQLDAFRKRYSLSAADTAESTRIELANVISELTGRSIDELERKSIYDLQEIANKAAEPIKIEAEVAKQELQRLTGERQQLEDDSRNRQRQRDEAERYREVASAIDAEAEAKKRDAEATKDLARAEQEAARASERRIKMQTEEDSRTLRERFNPAWSPETIQKELDSARGQVEHERKYQRTIALSGQGTEGEEQEYRASQARESDWLAYINQIENFLNQTPEVVNPFQNFSATQTDLEAHGADIGAGVGGSSIDDRLQKMSAYLQQIAENTKTTDPATMTQ